MSFKYSHNIITWFYAQFDITASRACRDVLMPAWSGSVTYSPIWADCTQRPQDTANKLVSKFQFFTKRCIK